MDSSLRGLVIAAAILIPLACAAQSDFGAIRLTANPSEGSLIVNVNTGTFEELVTIPGVAEELASGIFQYRPYERVEDLKRVPGIGDKKLEQIRPYVKVKGPTEPKKNRS
jgi:competence ComEA-like helix-hairpin-helix protein